MRLCDLGLTQPLQHQCITLRLCVCLQLSVSCVSVLVQARIYVGNACAVLWGVRKKNRKKRGSHINASFKGRPFKVWTTYSVRPVCSLWQPVKQENKWDLKFERKLTSLHAETVTFSPGWVKISRETVGSGELHLRVISMKSYTIFWTVSINLSINIKTIPWKLTALQELYRKPSKSHCSVTLRKHSELTMRCMLENRQEDWNKCSYFPLTYLTCCWIMWPSSRWFLSQLIRCAEPLCSAASNSI